MEAAFESSVDGFLASRRNKRSIFVGALKGTNGEVIEMICLTYRDCI